MASSRASFTRAACPCGSSDAMLIPSIDLQGGRIVQLVQGERLAVETTDIDGWIRKLRGQPKVQLIDLDAAKGAGDNGRSWRESAASCPAASAAASAASKRARDVSALGATGVIAGSALFTDRRRPRRSRDALAEAVGADRLIAAVDSRGGSVVSTAGARSCPTRRRAMQALEPYVGEFLLSQRRPRRAHAGHGHGGHRRRSRRTTTRAVTAAGGSPRWTRLTALDAIGVDAVVGMALYTGRIELGGGEARTVEVKSARAESQPATSAHARLPRARVEPREPKKC